MQKNVIVDKTNKIHGMTIDELWVYCEKLKEVHNRGNSIVSLIDASNKRKYLIGKFEPRRIFLEKTDKTVEFSISQIEKEKIKEVSKIPFSNLVSNKLKENYKNPKWLANEMNIPQSSIYGKLERDSFNAYDLIKIVKVLDIDIDEILETVEQN